MDRGFSLIEVVIVIAIMGILTALVMPNYNAIQRRAKLSALTSAGQTIQTALESYNLSAGTYPNGQNLNADALLRQLIQSGDLKAVPKNPYTGAPFSGSDSAGSIDYDAESNGQAYSLRLYGESSTSPSVTLTN